MQDLSSMKGDIDRGKMRLLP